MELWLGGDVATRPTAKIDRRQTANQAITFCPWTIKSCSTKRLRRYVVVSSSGRDGKKEGSVLFDDALSIFFICGYLASDTW